MLATSINLVSAMSASSVADSSSGVTWVPTSPVESLFPKVPGYTWKIIPSATSEIRCEHCARIALRLVGDCIVITHRHDSQPHKTVVSISSLGLARVS